MHLLKRKCHKWIKLRKLNTIINLIIVPGTRQLGASRIDKWWTIKWNLNTVQSTTNLIRMINWCQSGQREKMSNHSSTSIINHTRIRLISIYAKKLVISELLHLRSFISIIIIKRPLRKLSNWIKRHQYPVNIQVQFKTHACLCQWPIRWLKDQYKSMRITWIKTKKEEKANSHQYSKKHQIITFSIQLQMIHWLPKPCIRIVPQIVISILKNIRPKT